MDRNILLANSIDQLGAVCDLLHETVLALITITTDPTARTALEALQSSIPEADSRNLDNTKDVYDTIDDFIRKSVKDSVDDSQFTEVGNRLRVLRYVVLPGCMTDRPIEILASLAYLAYGTDDETKDAREKFMVAAKKSIKTLVAGAGQRGLMQFFTNEFYGTIKEQLATITFH